MEKAEKPSGGLSQVAAIGQAIHKVVIQQASGLGLQRQGLEDREDEAGERRQRGGHHVLVRRASRE